MYETVILNMYCGIIHSVTKNYKQIRYRLFIGIFQWQLQVVLNVVTLFYNNKQNKEKPATQNKFVQNTNECTSSQLPLQNEKQVKTKYIHLTNASFQNGVTFGFKLKKLLLHLYWELFKYKTQVAVYFPIIFFSI